VCAQPLKIEREIIVNNMIRKTRKKVVLIPKKESINLAYLCGVFAGDGSIGIRKKKYEYSLKCVGNPKDEKPFYKEIIGPLFQAVFGILPNIKSYDSGTTFGFIIYSKALILYLNQCIGLPVGKKYDSLCIPKKILDNDKLLINFVRGLFDTDGCISFKKKYKAIPYYPVISFSSKSEKFVREIADVLKNKGFKIVEIYNYKIKDIRFKKGYNLISRIELNGMKNLCLWLNEINFYNPKHNEKINSYYLNRELKK